MGKHHQVQHTLAVQYNTACNLPNSITTQTKDMKAMNIICGSSDVQCSPVQKHYNTAPRMCQSTAAIASGGGKCVRSTVERHRAIVLERLGNSCDLLLSPEVCVTVTVKHCYTVLRSLHKPEDTLGYSTACVCSTVQYSAVLWCRNSTVVQ